MQTVIKIFIISCLTLSLVAVNKVNCESAEWRIIVRNIEFISSTEARLTLGLQKPAGKLALWKTKPEPLLRHINGNNKFELYQKQNNQYSKIYKIKLSFFKLYNLLLVHHQL